MRMRIARRQLGPEFPLFVIAELGLNHGGSTDTALALVDSAAQAGASAVKLQSLRADRLVTGSCPAPAHVTAGSLREFFRHFELDEAAHRAIVRRARSRGLAFMATPFDEEVVGLLESLDCDAYKIASGDITHTRLIRRVAATGRPVVVSTGMANLDEIGQAVTVARRAGATHLALLHCVSAYPVPDGSENLRAIAELARTFDVPVGLSDHGTNPIAASIAVALGAALYEKHLVLDETGEAVDQAVSVTGAGLAEIVAEAERTRRALGHGRKICVAAEAVNLAASRRGLYAARDLRPGDRVGSEDIAILRPAAGLDAHRWSELVGIRVNRDVKAGSAFLPDDLGKRSDVHERTNLTQVA